MDCEMTDPRTLVLPSGSPIVVHYNDGSMNETKNDYPVFFRPSDLIESEYLGTYIQIKSKSVFGYECKIENIIDRDKYEPEYTII